MGFDCVICGEREIWAFESKVQRVCKDCYNSTAIFNNTTMQIKGVSLCSGDIIKKLDEDETMPVLTMTVNIVRNPT